jgi:hypothetical protein
MGAGSNMEGFSRLLNYLGNVKAPIMSKIVWISLEKFLGLTARRAQVCGNQRRFSRRAVRRYARALSCNWTKPRAPSPN